MSKALFSDIFGDWIKGENAEIFKNSVIERCGLDPDSRSLTLELKSDNYITSENRLRLHDMLCGALKLNSCEISCLCGGAPDSGVRSSDSSS